MSLAWDDSIAGIQDALAAAVIRLRDANAGVLPSSLVSEDFRVIGSLNRDAKTFLPVGIRVFPPANSSLDAEVSNAFEGALAFPCIITIKALADEDGLDLLRKCQALIIGALADDPLLGGLTGGPASPAVLLGSIDTDGKETTQEVTVRLIVRNAA